MAAARADFETFSPNFIAGHLRLNDCDSGGAGGRELPTAELSAGSSHLAYLWPGMEGDRTAPAPLTLNIECAVPRQSAAPSLQLFFFLSICMRTRVCMCV